MKFNAVLLASILALFLFHQPAAASPPAASTKRILVKFQSHINEEQKANILTESRLKKQKTIEGAGVDVLELPDDSTVSDVVGKLKHTSEIVFAEADDLVAPEGPGTRLPGVKPNDPRYKNQWHLPKIQAPNAWAKTKATDVILAVCDSGVEASHPDLSNILLSQYGFNTVDNTTNWEPNGAHGTMTTGTMAAAADNRTGVAGVAWGAKVIPIRITNLSNANAYVSDAAECITYAADKGARAINLSYGMAQYSTIDAAASYAETKNAVTVVSASNNATNPGWPDFPSFLVASATTSTDTLASFSNYGAYVDLSAPGVNILTTTTGGGYAYANGTSFSAPITVGTLGLLFGVKPALSAVQAKEIILSTVDDVGPAGEDDFFGKGRVNAYKAVLATSAY